MCKPFIIMSKKKYSPTKGCIYARIPVFCDPAAPETHSFVSRVVAAPGDTVEVSEEGGLIVNGNTMIEPGIFYPTKPYEGFLEYPVTLGADEYFVMADFRNGGADSRFFGAVNTDEILGTVISILRRNNL